MGETLRVFISADMEGVTGVTHPQDAQYVIVSWNAAVHADHRSTLTDAVLSKSSVKSVIFISL